MHQLLAFESIKLLVPNVSFLLLTEKVRSAMSVYSKRIYLPKEIVGTFSSSVQTISRWMAFVNEKPHRPVTHERQQKKEKIVTAKWGVDGYKGLVVSFVVWRVEKILGHGNSLWAFVHAWYPVRERHLSLTHPSVRVYLDEGSVLWEAFTSLHSRSQSAPTVK